MNPQALLLTAFGLGRLPVAPGTCGSLLPVAVTLVVLSILGPGWWIDGILLLLAAIFSIICLMFSADEEQRCGAKDPQYIVADEVAGQSIALLFLPWHSLNGVHGWPADLCIAAVAFGAFRVLDILKPPPIRNIQSLSGGWGILADDLVAGTIGLLITQAITRWLLPMML